MFSFDDSTFCLRVGDPVGERLAKIARERGILLMMCDHRVAYQWAQAGGSNVNPAGMWWAAVPRERRGHPDGQRSDQQTGWHPRFGDRTQQLVFIGQKMDAAGMRARLDSCLLDERLASADSKAWAELRNPFPELRMAEGTA